MVISIVDTNFMNCMYHRYHDEFRTWSDENLSSDKQPHNEGSGSAAWWPRFDSSFGIFTPVETPRPGGPHCPYPGDQREALFCFPQPWPRNWSHGQHCYVFTEGLHEPNETQVILDRERASCIEPIFCPVKEKEDETLASLTKQLINAFPDKSADLAQNIVICGGPTDCTNFNYRLLSELYKCKAAKIIRIFCPPERPFTCWVGASVIYFDDEYVDQGMSFNEYNFKYLPAEQ